MKMTTWLMAAALALPCALGPRAAYAQPERDGGPEMGPGGDRDDLGWGDDFGPEEGRGMRKRGRGQGQRGDMRGQRGRGQGARQGGRQGGRQGMGKKARGKLREMARDPEVRKVIKAQREGQRKLQKLVKKFRDEKDAKAKASLKTEIKAGLDKQFDADMAVHEMKIKKMEGELTRLKSRITKRRGLKKKIIDRKLGELTEEEEGWEW
ncbi:hypothetical protein ACFL2T_03150 [Elusimicrobiota bacterium]